jgi:N utilization substance protein B
VSDAPAGGSAKGRGTPAKSARRRAREFALQGLYEWLVSHSDVASIEVHLGIDNPAYAKADVEHFKGLLNGVVRAVEALHERIAPHLDRPVAELSPVEHAILLLATYELSHHPEIPYRVVINEAVELAKTFGGTDGFKYVNGVLDRVAAQLRAIEAGSASSADPAPLPPRTGG